MKQTPLFYACREGHLEMVRMLISEFQANTEALDLSGQSAVMMATLDGHTRVVEALLDEFHVPIQVKDNNNQRSE